MRPLLAILAARARQCGWGVIALALAAVVYGGGKRNVRFPQTLPGVSWLTDAGSYVASNVVHLAFTRVVVPDSATCYIDLRPLGSTNDTDWVQWCQMPFADFSIPADLIVADATNYEFAVYTDWTPGSVAITNGIWRANWGLDRIDRRAIIPVRSQVFENGKLLNKVMNQ